MLSDQDRRTLSEMERHLRAEDPALARRFEVRSERPYRRTSERVLAGTVALASVVLVVAALLGSPALLGAGVSVLVVAIAVTAGRRS